jgi:large subunit ribosomal protein L22
MITASLKNYRHSPRKVRSVANLVRGKSVSEALEMLAYLPKKATGSLAALLNSAVANAKNNFNIEKSDLFIQELRVDQGVTLKRSMPVSRGSAHPINKRSSNVLVTLAPLSEKPVKGRRWSKPAIKPGVKSTDKK